MPKNDLSIEIVSAKNIALSSMSERSRTAIKKLLSKHYKHVRITLIDTLNDLDQIVNRQPDVVVLGMKKLHESRDGSDVTWISDHLQQHGITTTGSTSRSHNFELNKQLAKQMVSLRGVATAESHVYSKNNTSDIASKLSSFPQFVKPVDMGGGDGIDKFSLVNNVAQLQNKVKRVFELQDSDALVELFLPGREFSVALLKDQQSDTLHAMPLEIKATNNDGILSLEEKLQDNEEVSLVKDVDLKNRVVQVAKDSFNAIGGRDYGRIDIRLDAQNKAHFLEANLIPSLIAGYGNFAKACKLNAGINYEQMILHIVELALDRLDFAQDSSAAVHLANPMSAY